MIISCLVLLVYSLTSFKSFSKSSSSAPMMLMAGLEHGAPDKPHYRERERENKTIRETLCATHFFNVLNPR